MTARLIAALVASGFAVAGCGLKGPLTLPEKPGEVTIRPARTGPGPAAPAEGAQPAQPATPPVTAPEPPPQVPPTKDAPTGG